MRNQRFVNERRFLMTSAFVFQPGMDLPNVYQIAARLRGGAGNALGAVARGAGRVRAAAGQALRRLGQAVRRRFG